MGEACDMHAVSIFLSCLVSYTACRKEEKMRREEESAASSFNIDSQKPTHFLSFIACFCNSSVSHMFLRSAHSDSQ